MSLQAAAAIYRASAGRSRQYEKVLDAATGEREQRTAYEVSVRLIRRKEEAENER